MGHRRDINRMSLPSLKQKHIPKSKPAGRCVSAKPGVPTGHQSDVTLLQNGKNEQLCASERGISGVSQAFGETAWKHSARGLLVSMSPDPGVKGEGELHQGRRGVGQHHCMRHSHMSGR